MSVTDDFFGSGPAELYTLTHWRKMNYRRFETAERAVRFCVERLPARSLTATVLEVGEERFDHRGIGKLYDALSRPLSPPTAAPAAAPAIEGGRQPAAMPIPPRRRTVRQG